MNPLESVAKYRQQEAGPEFWGSIAGAPGFGADDVALDPQAEPVDSGAGGVGEAADLGDGGAVRCVVDDWTESPLM